MRKLAPRSFLRCLWVDLCESCAALSPKVLLLTFITLAVVSFSRLVMMAQGVARPGPPFAEVVGTCLGGMPPYDPGRDSRFVLPTAWLLVTMAMIWVSLDYAYRELLGVGCSVVVATGSRWAWWLSKCVVVTVWSLVSYLVVLSICMVVAGVLGGSALAFLSYDEACALGFLATADFPATIMPFLSAALTTVCALSLGGSLVSLLLGPRAGFCAMAAYLLVSAYLDSPLLLGSYLMVARSDQVMAGGTNASLGLFLAALVAAGSVLLGGVLFSRLDLVDRGSVMSNG